jgi:hypothetical protein
MVMNTVINTLRKAAEDIIIVEGGAIGVDGMARTYAINNQIKYIEMRADWNHLGKTAGIIRNNHMQSYIYQKATEEPDTIRMVLLLWNGTSKGTASNIEIAKAYGNPTIIAFIRTDENSKAFINRSVPEKCHIIVNNEYSMAKLSKAIEEWVIPKYEE